MGGRFGALFFGIGKDLCLFWEKEWKSIATEGYSEWIVRLIHGTVSPRPDVPVVQDKTPHNAIQTIREFRKRGTSPIN